MAQTRTVTPPIYSDPIIVPIDRVHPNTYNPNIVPGILFEEILKDIRKNGFIGAIIVRPKPDNSYEIVDGEHRHKAAKQLGFKEIPVIVREFDDDTAKLNTFRWNHERGFFDSVKTADLIRDLNKRHGLDELSRELGMSHEEMIQYLRPKEIPESWNIPILPNPYSEPTNREPLIFTLSPKDKRLVQEQLSNYARYHKLKDSSQALVHLVKSTRVEERQCPNKTGKK